MPLSPPRFALLQSTMVPTLPTEITHLIIENLRTALEEHTLASCSLVCQSWRSFVQPLLFQYVRLCVTKPLDQFLAFLKASPHLAAAIRILNIWANIHPTIMVIDAESGKCRLSPVLLLQVAANLPLSAELQLQGITLIGWPDDIPLPTTPVKLHRLKLHFLTFRPFAHSQCISYDLFSFFELDELDVADSHTDEFINPTAALAVALPAETRPIARSLEIIGVDAFVMRNLLYGGLHPDHLATVRFFPTDGESLGLAGLILRTQGAGVLNIELCISHTINFEGPQDASKCSRRPMCFLRSVDRQHHLPQHSGTSSVCPHAHALKR